MTQRLIGNADVWDTKSIASVFQDTERGFLSVVVDKSLNMGPVRLGAIWFRDVRFSDDTLVADVPRICNTFYLAQRWLSQEARDTLRSHVNWGQVCELVNKHLDGERKLS